MSISSNEEIDDSVPDRVGPTTIGRQRRRHPNLIAFAISIVFAILVRLFVFQSFYIPSGSMIPSLMIGDRIVVSKISFALEGVHQGDMVVFNRPPLDTVDPNIEDLVKRVIGLPGETISSANGHVLINGKVLAEPYLPPGDLTYQIKRQKIPAGDYFLMGDNRGDSYDSRYFGVVPGRLFVGKVVLRFYPFGRFAIL